MLNSSIIIPTFNGIDRISNVLKSLENQSVSDFEVIVSIDGSTDLTEELLKRNNFNLKELKIIFHENGGRSAAKNRGAIIANADLLIFLDDDMRAAKDLVEKHVAFHRSKNRSLLTGRPLDDIKHAKTDVQKYKAELGEKWFGSMQGGRMDKSHLFFTAANCSIEKSHFFELGGFDEILTDSEDFDLALRALNASFEIHYDPLIVAWHDDDITMSSYLLRQRQYTASRKIMWIKNDEKEKSEGIVFFKRVLLYPFKLSFLGYLVDNTKIFLVLPKKVRYRVYDFIVTGATL